MGVDEEEEKDNKEYKKQKQRKRKKKTEIWKKTDKGCERRDKRSVRGKNRKISIKKTKRKGNWWKYIEI